MAAMNFLMPLALLGGLIAYRPALATDIYDPKANTLMIPWVQGGGNVYSNVKLQVSEVLRLNQAFTSSVVDFYDSKYDELYIGRVDVEGKLYKGVVIRPGEILSVGGSDVAPKDCGTPTFDYVVGVGDYTMTTNLWGIRGKNTWETWLEGDFLMCLEGRAISSSSISAVAADFTWQWPLEPYIDPRKPITKNFSGVNYTPDGKPMTPVSLNDTNLTFHHDIAQRGSGNNQTFYDLYAGPTSASLESIFGTGFEGAVNISLRLFSSTGYVGKDETIYPNVKIDGQTWIVRTNGRNWIQFMVADNAFFHGSVRLREFLTFMKSINFQTNMEKYFLKSIELGNEQIDGSGGLLIKSFHVTH